MVIIRTAVAYPTLFSAVTGCAARRDCCPPSRGVTRAAASLAQCGRCGAAHRHGSPANGARKFQPSSSGSRWAVSQRAARTACRPTPGRTPAARPPHPRPPRHRGSLHSSAIIWPPELARRQKTAVSQRRNNGAAGRRGPLGRGSPAGRAAPLMCPIGAPRAAAPATASISYANGRGHSQLTPPAEPRRGARARALRHR